MSLPKCFLEQKVAIVTGASSGIGRHVAQALANAGVNLVLAARSVDALADACGEVVTRSGVKAIAVPCDVSRLGDLERLVQAAQWEFGGVDILVNNAAVEAFAHLHDLEPEEIQRVVQTNLTAPLQLTRLVIPHMTSRGWGHVINMASLAGKYSPPYAAVYAATKAGLIALSQSLRNEYRSRNISATAVCPGFTAGAGISERMERDVGRETPFWLGGTTVSSVARATIRAIRKNQPEVLVNTPPHRLALALAELFPRVGEWLIRKAAGRFFRDLARARRPTQPASVRLERKPA